MKKRKILSLILAAALSVSLFAGCAQSSDQPQGGSESTASASSAENAESKAEEADGDTAGSDSGTATPRNETVIMSGLMQTPPASFNYFSAAAAWPALTEGTTELTYETLFLTHMFKTELEPLIGMDYSFDDDYTLRVNLNPAAKWSDGEPLTSEDVKYTYEFGQRYDVQYSTVWDYIDAVEAPDEHTILFKLKSEPYNPLIVQDTFTYVPIHPKHIWEKVEADNGNDIGKIKAWFNEECIGSGPYKLHYYDDTKVTLIRDDNYWGNEALYGGKLPAAKYVTHVLLKSNDAYLTQFVNNDIDTTSSFISQVWKLWEDGAPIGTYLKDEPYYVTIGINPIIFNTTRPGLDRKEVRKAIAMGTDFAKVSEIAVSNYSPEFTPTITLLTDAEKDTFNYDQLQDKLWGYDVDGANALLDSIGAAKGSDGIRVLDGTRLSYELMCPYGFTDWNAALEIVAQGGGKTGLDLKTNFPDRPIWQSGTASGDFDMTMVFSDTAKKPSQPWARMYKHLQQTIVPVGEMAFGNEGRWENARMGELLDLIPAEKDPEKLKELYTEVNEIYLDEVPCFSPYVRPDAYTFNETYWKGWPTEDNNPENLSVGTLGVGGGVKLLWYIEPTGK